MHARPDPHPFPSPALSRLSPLPPSHAAPCRYAASFSSHTQLTSSHSLRALSQLELWDLFIRPFFSRLGTYSCWKWQLNSLHNPRGAGPKSHCPLRRPLLARLPSMWLAWPVRSADAGITSIERLATVAGPRLANAATTPWYAFQALRFSRFTSTSGRCASLSFADRSFSPAWT